MRISSQLLLNFVLNAAWQIALIAALASLGAWLLRSSSARYRHWRWVGAFCLAFLIPAATSMRGDFETAAPTTIEPVSIGEPFEIGRASCRERGEIWVVGVGRKKKREKTRRTRM